MVFSLHIRALQTIGGLSEGRGILHPGNQSEQELHVSAKMDRNDVQELSEDEIAFLLPLLL